MQLERLLLHLKLDGWCVLEGVIPADQIEHVCHSVEAAVAAHRNPAAPSGIGHLPGMINFDQSFAPFLADENLLALVGAMLGPSSAHLLHHRHNQLPGQRARRLARRLALQPEQRRPHPCAVSRCDGPPDHLVDAGPFYRGKRRHPPRPRQPPILRTTPPATMASIRWPLIPRK